MEAQDWMKITEFERRKAGRIIGIGGLEGNCVIIGRSGESLSEFASGVELKGEREYNG